MVVKVVLRIMEEEVEGSRWAVEEADLWMDAGLWAVGLSMVALVAAEFG